MRSRIWVRTVPSMASHGKHRLDLHFRRSKVVMAWDYIISNTTEFVWWIALHEIHGGYECLTSLKFTLLDERQPSVLWRSLTWYTVFRNELMNSLQPLAARQNVKHSCPDVISSSLIFKWFLRAITPSSWCSDRFVSSISRTNLAGSVCDPLFTVCIHIAVWERSLYITVLVGSAVRTGGSGKLGAKARRPSPRRS